MKGTFDEDVLAEWDETAEEVDAQYERAYAGIEDPLGKDFDGWENEGVWPPE